MSVASVVAPTARRSARQSLALRLLARREFALAILIACTVVGVSIANPAFLALTNLRELLVTFVPAAIIGCGVTLVVVTGEIDISVGALMGMLAAMMGLLASPMHGNWPVWLVIPLVLLAGIAVGCVNGVLVAVAGIPSIIVTLGVYTALPGITNLITHGKYITHVPPGLRFWGTANVGGIPISLWAAAAVAGLCMLLTARTPTGRRIYAVGSNSHAARLAGIGTTRIKIFVFACTGLFVGIATLVTVTQLPVIEPTAGASLALEVVTCVVVGGASISGGKGTIIGTLLGVCLLGMVRTVFIFLKLGEHAVYWEHAVQGAMILIAVLADHLAARRNNPEAVV